KPCRIQQVVKRLLKQIVESNEATAVDDFESGIPFMPCPIDVQHGPQRLGELVTGFVLGSIRKKGGRERVQLELAIPFLKHPKTERLRADTTRSIWPKQLSREIPI